MATKVTTAAETVSPAKGRRKDAPRGETLSAPTDKTDKRGIRSRAHAKSLSDRTDKTDKSPPPPPLGAKGVDSADADTTPICTSASGGCVNRGSAIEPISAGTVGAASDLARQPVSRVRWVPRASLVPNDYNPNHVPPLELKLLKRSILLQGWTQPIVVLADGVTIVDGFHRWTVAGDKQIAALTGGLVPVVVIDADQTQRVAATIRHNRARGEHGITPMSSIVSGLLASGLAIEEVMAELGMQREEVLRLADQRGRPEAIGGERSFGAAWEPR